MSLRDEIIGKLCLLCGGTGDLVDGKCPLFLCDAVRDTAGLTLAIIRKAVGGIKNPVPISRTGEYLGFCEGIKAVEKLLEVEYE